MSEKRRTTRIKVGATTSATIDGMTYVVRIDDVSYGGVGLLSDMRPELGSTVSLTANDGDIIEGKVVRHTDDGFALNLDFSEKSASYALKNILGRVFDNNNGS